MPDYSKAKIYRLVGGGHTYYGSTCSPLYKRKHEHKSDLARWKRGDHRKCSSFKCVEAEDYEIFLVEEYPCENREQLNARERWWIENNECVNKAIPNRGKKESDKAYRSKTRDRYNSNNRLWYEANKERILLDRKINRMFSGKGK